MQNLWLLQFEQCVNYLFWFKRNKGCCLWPCFWELEDQSWGPAQLNGEGAAAKQSLAKAAEL